MDFSTYRTPSGLPPENFEEDGRYVDTVPMSGAVPLIDPDFSGIRPGVWPPPPRHVVVPIVAAHDATGRRTRPLQRLLQLLGG